MVSKIAAGALAGIVLLILACSDAPVIPVQPSNRQVLTEIQFDDTT
jgi:hypothetical protein